MGRLSQMRIAFIDAARRGVMRDGEISWAKTYEKRMRRFNFEIILFALVSLPLLISCLFRAWWAFFQ
jgi:hypothetical protein